MKEFLKKSGLIFILAGIVVIAYTELTKMESNPMLILSGGLIVFGLLFYVVMNNILE
jgi:predicted transporter